MEGKGRDKFRGKKREIGAVMEDDGQRESETMSNRARKNSRHKKMREKRAKSDWFISKMTLKTR